MKKLNFRNMLLILELLLLLIVYVKAKAVCEYDPGITINPGMDKTPDVLYVYAPFFSPIRLGNNSVMLMDKTGTPLTCASADTLSSQRGIEFEHPWQIEHGMFNVKLFEDDIMIATMQTYYKIDRVYLNNYIFLFMDMNFQPIPGMPEIYPNMSSTYFRPHFNVFPHDYIVIDEKHLMVSINEYIVVEAKEYFLTLDHTFRLYSTGFMIVDRLTSKEVTGLSGFYFFFDPDNWYDWLSTRLMVDILRRSAYFHIFTHISSIIKVPGEHWDEQFTGMRTFLSSTRNFNVIDLFVWDFEKGEVPYFIWRFPHNSTCPALYPWLKRWEVIGDPQNGPTHSHDINTYNEPPKHILVHDNGDSSRYDAGNGLVCPISRACEYKIDYNANGKGYHRLTLTWSYPPPEALPPVLPSDVEFSIVEGETGEECVPFHFYNTYLFYGSSVRRLVKGEPYIGHGAFSIENYSVGWDFERPSYPYPNQKFRVYNTETGEIVGIWNSTASKYFISFRIATVTPEKIATPFAGEYAHEINTDIHSGHTFIF